MITYDNNAVDFNDEYCLYINTSSSNWIIPAYEPYGGSTAYGGSLGLTTDDLGIINYHGYLDGTANAAYEEYIPVLSSKTIEADSLQHVKLSAMSDAANPSLTFSTEQSEVFIYEIDANTIGVSIDSDGDGSFDTPLDPDPSAMLGDLDGSGVIDIMDVIKINKYLLGSVSLDAGEKAAADVDGSGEIDSTDSLNILKYVVELITAFA